jgi:hypothetical protein
MNILRLLLSSLLIIPLTTMAQDDLMDMLEKEAGETTVPAVATFKSTRIINGQSVETMKRNHLDFRISHRFGRLNSGAYELFGLDQAVMRMGFEYGITDDLMIGIGRSGEQKAYDFFGKYKLIKQATGARQVPISVTLFGSSVIRTQRSFVPGEIFAFEDKLTYTGQLLIARKFSESLSLQITPTYLYRNRPELPGDQRLLLALGIGGRLKVSRRVSINAEYFYAFRDNTTNLPYYNSLALGVDIETGGHVFQLHFTNSLGMIEKQFIGETTGSWGKGDVHYGFNISRTFSLDKKKKMVKN